MCKREIIFFCFFFLVYTISSGKARDIRRDDLSSNDFDVLIFTQRWPQTVCFAWKENAPSHSCLLPADDEWTIHGIWPSQYHKLGPQFCNSSMPFNKTALKPLESELKIKWIDVEQGRGAYSFWKHEWTKHGTCAAVLERLNSEVKYFQEGLALLDMYDMKHVLGKASITPGKRYELKKIFGAIEKILGRRAEIMCEKNEKSGELYVFEIRICFDKSLQLIHCDGVYQYPTNCGKAEWVNYPGDVPQDYHVIQV